MTIKQKIDVIINDSTIKRNKPIQILINENDKEDLFKEIGGFFIYSNGAIICREMPAFSLMDNFVRLIISDVKEPQKYNFL